MTPATLGDELRTLDEAEAPRPPGNHPVPGVVNRSHFWQGRVAFWLLYETCRTERRCSADRWLGKQGYDLLDPHQQALLRCLAVFVGGWTLEAAEEVGTLSGVPDVLDGLAALVEQNLVVRDDGAPVPHYRLLETIREFALEQLLASGEEERVRRIHLQFLLQLARENDLERVDAEISTRLARLQAEEANLLAGIAWGLDHDPESTMAVPPTSPRGRGSSNRRPGSPVFLLIMRRRSRLRMRRTHSPSGSVMCRRWRARRCAKGASR